MPAPVNRTLLSRGPAVVKYNGGTFYSKEDIVLDMAIGREAVQSSAFGAVKRYRNAIAPTLQVPLVGEIEHLNLLYPFANKLPGQSIFGATDTPLEIIPIDPSQQVITFASAALNSEPELTLGVSAGVALGTAGFVFLPRQGVPLTDPNAWFTRRDRGPGEIVGFDPDKIKVQGYDLHWISGGTWTMTDGAGTTSALNYDVGAEALQSALNGLEDITTAGGVTVAGNHRYGYTVTFTAPGAGMPSLVGSVVDGMPGGTVVRVDVVVPGAAEVNQVVRVSFSPWGWFPTETAITVRPTANVTARSADGLVYDYVYEGGEISAECLPLNVTEMDLMAATHVQGPGAALGSDPASSAHNLIIAASGLHVILYGASIDNAGAIWSSTNQRAPSTTWTAARKVVADSLTPLYYIGETAPGA